jgi:hypothetical protein
VTSAPDPILAAVLQRRVHAITQEMATVLMRSSRSPIFNEIGDLVTVVFDADGRLDVGHHAHGDWRGEPVPHPLTLRVVGDVVGVGRCARSHGHNARRGQRGQD